MKIQILSDLHQEFEQKDFIYNKADLIIIAGDLDVRTRGIEWLLNTITSIPIIYILGNHEYYGGSYPATLLKIKQKALGTNVHVLENETIDIDGIRFHGATMWTDFSLLGNPKYYGIICQERVNDYKKIRRDPTYSKLRTIDTFSFHNQSRKWLEQSLSMSDKTCNIVITHHAPSAQSLSDNQRCEPVAAAYASNLESIMEMHSPHLWIHGHIHKQSHYYIGQTEVRCNPRGYPKTTPSDFIEELYIEL